MTASHAEVLLPSEGTLVRAIDIGGTKIAVGVIDDHGRVLSRAGRPHRCPARLQGQLVRLIEGGCSPSGARCWRQDHWHWNRGSTGPVYPFTGEIGVVNFPPGWQGANPIK